MTCLKCGYNNKEGAEICEFCKSPLYAERKKTKEKESIWSKLYVINLFTTSVIIVVCFLLLVILYFLR